MPYSGLIVALLMSITFGVVAIVAGALGRPDVAVVAVVLLLIVGLIAGYRHIRLKRRPNPATRKSVESLTRADLMTYPIWEYLYEEDKYDETYVKPVPEQMLYADRHCVMAADFLTASGQKYLGCIELSTGKHDFRDPSISFTETKWLVLTPPGGQIYCFAEHMDRLPQIFERDYSKHMDRLQSAFGMPLERVFPITWRLRAEPFDWEGPRDGVLPYPVAIGYQAKVMTPLPES